MDVLRLITRLNVGGPARHALLLTHSLRPELSTMLAAGEPAPDEGELSDPRVDVVPISLVRPLAPRRDVQGLRDVRRLLDRERPRLVHTHMAKAGTVGRVAAATRRRPPVLVHTFHGHVLEGYFSPAAQQAFLLVEKVLARRTDVLIAVSEETRDDLLGMAIGRPEQWRVIPLGLDLSRHLAVTGRSGALRARIGLADDVPLVGMVGRLAPIKDPMTMLDAIRRLDGVHLAVVGDGEMRDAVRAGAAERGMQDRVHLLGWMFDVPAVMADLDVAALSSRNEGTPVALIEAAACGVPAVATAVGGVARVVADGTTGLLVPPADPAALADALAKVLGDGGLAASMGIAARAASHAFSADRLVEDIRALYRELL